MIRKSKKIYKLIHNTIPLTNSYKFCFRKTLNPNLPLKHFCSTKKTQEIFMDRKSTFDRIENVVRLLPVLKNSQNLVITEKTNFEKDLKLDSLDRVEVIIAIEEEFDFNIDEDVADSLVTVKDAVDYVTRSSNAT